MLQVEQQARLHGEIALVHQHRPPTQQIAVALQGKVYRGVE